jgi:small subunit ribosomal protein S6e
MKSIKEGNRIRKLIRGNMITEEIYQLNCHLIDGSLPEKQASGQEGDASGSTNTDDQKKKK